MWVEIAVSWGNCSVLCRMYERGKRSGTGVIVSTGAINGTEAGLSIS